MVSVIVFQVETHELFDSSENGLSSVYCIATFCHYTPVLPPNKVHGLEANIKARKQSEACLMYCQPLRLESF